MGKTLWAYGLLVALTACDRDRNKGSSDAPAPQEGPQTSDADPQEEPRDPSNVLDSDLREAEVPACKDGQVFAFETCWDMVLLGFDGSVSLTRGDEVQAVVEAGGKPKDRLVPLYKYASGSNGHVSQPQMEVVNDRLRALEKKHPLEYYWFLPTTMVTTANGDGHGIGGERILETRFRLRGQGFARGHLAVCDTGFDLPVTVGALEEACGAQIGEAWTWSAEERGGVRLRFSFEAVPDDQGPGWVRRRRAEAVEMTFTLSPETP